MCKDCYSDIASFFLSLYPSKKYLSKFSEDATLSYLERNTQLSM